MNLHLQLTISTYYFRKKQMYTFFNGLKGGLLPAKQHFRNTFKPLKTNFRKSKTKLPKTRPCLFFKSNRSRRSQLEPMCVILLVLPPRVVFINKNSRLHRSRMDSPDAIAGAGVEKWKWCCRRKLLNWAKKVHIRLRERSHKSIIKA